MVKTKPENNTKKEWVIRILIFLTSGGMSQIIKCSDEAQEWVELAKSRKPNIDGKQMTLEVQVPDSLQIARRSK